MQPAIDHGIRVIRELGRKMFSFDHVAKNVETSLFAATVKGVLLYHINVSKRLISYGELATATKGLPKGGQLAQALERIAEDDHLNKRILSTAIVVNQNTKMPGEGFFKQCRSLGHPVPTTPEGELLFWKQLLGKLDVLPLMCDIGLMGCESAIDPALLKSAAGDKDIVKEGEVGILAGLWRNPEVPPYEDRQPVPDISLHPEIKDLRTKLADTSRARAFPHILIEKPDERVVGHVGQRDRQGRRMSDRNTTPASCEHANENPHVCKCPSNCYCKENTCKRLADPNPEKTQILNEIMVSEALPRERELNQQVDQAEEGALIREAIDQAKTAQQEAASERKTIQAKDLKEGDVVMLLEPLKTVTVKTVEPRLMIESLKSHWVINWTDTEGTLYSCVGYTILTLKVRAPGAAPASNLP